MTLPERQTILVAEEHDTTRVFVELERRLSDLDRNNAGQLRTRAGATATSVAARVTSRPHAVVASERAASQRRGNHPRAGTARSRSRRMTPSH